MLESRTAEQIASEVDRRRSARFGLEREVKFKLLNGRGKEAEQGLGKTVNMSSSGVFFTLDKPARLGQRAELFISWPAQLNNKCPLTLVAKGRIVRTVDGAAGMEIQQFEFRTQQSAPITPIKA